MPKQSSITQRNYIICIDGTGNDEQDKYLTNIAKFHQALDTSPKSHQLAYYYRGVGNEVDHDKLGQKLGFNFGFGAEELKDRAYKDLCKSYQPNDRLFILGFSRGAAIARMLAMHIYEEGVNKRSVSIEMLGIWDTVASFGIPMDIGPIPFQKINLFKDLSIAPNIKKTYHLVAIDEKQTPFEATLINKNNTVEEIWFIGGHCNIGGGIPKTGLSNITLKFMMNRAIEQGIRFTTDPNSLETNITEKIRLYPGNLPTQIRPIQVLVKEKNNSPIKLYRKFVNRIKKWRSKKQIETKNILLPPPKIHYTVFERMEKLGSDYNPQNVKMLNQNYLIVNSE